VQRLALIGEVLLMPPGRDPGRTQRRRDLLGRPALTVSQQLYDAVQHGFGQPLRHRRDGCWMQQPLDLVQIRDHFTRHGRPALQRVRRQPVPQRLVGKGFQHVLHHADPRGRLDCRDLPRRRHRDHLSLVAQGPH
jgi:hypothetical protein